MEILLHLELLELVPGIDDQLPGLVALQNRLDVLLAKGTGAAGNKDGLAIEHNLRDT